MCNDYTCKVTQAYGPLPNNTTHTRPSQSRRGLCANRSYCFKAYCRVYGKKQFGKLRGLVWKLQLLYGGNTPDSVLYTKVPRAG